LNTDNFIRFKSSIEGILPPEKFTFPFYYDPHPLSVIAAQELQEYLKTQKDWEHNFGLEEGQTGLIIGKMFGVLVVENQQGEIGYLCAFSGKLADSNEHAHFVPPVFDMLTKDGFFNAGMRDLNAKTDIINTFEASDELNEARALLLSITKEVENSIEERRLAKVEAKRLRKIRRIEAQETLPTDEFNEFNTQLVRESLQAKYEFAEFVKSEKSKIDQAKHSLKILEDRLVALKRERKATSGKIQQQLFESYQFLNAQSEQKNLLDIFSEEGKQPPSGAGECAAPKLLHYAYLNKLKPLCMAEFWWGSSPASEIRKHGFFYPACRGKCEPILGHMLKGLDVDPNPIIAPPKLNKEIEIIYEDDQMAVINKPHDFLSVPGKTIEDCVHKRMKEKYPSAEGPLIVHRLDMATSGILLIAKTKEAHKQLQKQFIEKSVKKRYVALLDGELKGKSGMIDLPLRIDLDDRPRQLVCYEYGKSAQTKYEVVEIKNGQTRIHFYPLTGRTHQLRMHAAHKMGLNAPIIGDDLYGKKANRLCLHAERIEFAHPKSRRPMVFQIEPDF